MTKISRDPWKKTGKTFLWLSWLYPFLRIAVLLPIAATENILSDETVQRLLLLAKYLHGGAAVSAFVVSGYMVYFAVSVLAYLAYHYRLKKRIGWGQRAALAFVVLFNFANIPLTHLAQEATDREYSHPGPRETLGQPEAPAPDDAKKPLFKAIINLLIVH